ncbi:MAG TPA: four-carbon acid sugar kinase family protein [Opitutus sp.]|nr:four-carbon acid sugar kinase family protein [Opitutus sp.]
MADPSPVPEAKVVVLDDDPTGTQTVHDVPVLTEWSVDALATELTAPGHCFYVLTNTRAFPAERARAINCEIGENLVAAGGRSGRAFRVVSRSDSTLRGHFPVETDALAEALGGGVDATLIVPAFFEGGRITVNDVHYVLTAGGRVPAGDTEFARDSTFGYRASNLREWVEEKTGGRVRAAEVFSISLDDLRGETTRLMAKLQALAGNAVAIVNAEQPGDLSALAWALHTAEANGKRFLYRTAASFVAAYAGIEPRPLLRTDEIAAPGSGGGLVVVGSHVGRTSAQLARLLERPEIAAVELPVERLLADERRAAEIETAGQRLNAALAAGRTAVVYTSRNLVTGGDARETLAIGEAVSRGLVGIVARIARRPRWLIAKGGITSSDVATKALGVKRAVVLGQAAAGVPVWRLGAEAVWPGLGYVVFPGNVGDEKALARLVERLG